jgi:hypothetical protein
MENKENKAINASGRNQISDIAGEDEPASCKAWPVIKSRCGPRPSKTGMRYRNNAYKCK